MEFTDEERYQLWRHTHGFDRHATRIAASGTRSPEGAGVSGPHAFLPTQEVAGYNRERLKMSDPYTRSKMQKLDQQGGPIQRPIDVVTDGNRAVISDGNHRAQWAKGNDVEQVPVRFHKVSPDDWDLSRDSRSARVGPGLSEWMKTNPGVMKDWYGSPEESYAIWGDRHASRWFTASWDDYDDDYDQRRAEEDAMWDDHDEYEPTDEEQRWLADDSNEIPEDPDVENQARQDAIGSGFGTAEDDAHDELADAKNKDWNTYADLIPPKDHGSQGARPPMTFEPVGNLATNGIMARHAADGRPIGHLMWTPDGEISSVNTHPDFGGRGVANMMLYHARANSDTYHPQTEWTNPIHHSNMLTEHGERWARSDPHHTMPRNFTSVNVQHGQGTKKPYSNYLGAGQEYIPAHKPYTGQTEDFMKANSFVGKDVKGYTGTKPPPREYVPPGAGHLDPHLGPRAATMNWGGSSG